MDENEIALIAGQVESGYRRGAWPEVSTRDLLWGLTAGDAAAHPIPKAHSAWEIALHLGFWHDAVRRRLAGAAVEYERDEDWPSPASATSRNWRAALEGVDRAHLALVEAIKDLAPSRLGELVPGRPFTVYFMLHGVPQHDLYHGGQIMMLTKALRAKTGSA